MKIPVTKRTGYEINHVRAGQMIRRARALAGVAQGSLAAEMKLDQARLSQMESGKRPWTENHFTLAAFSINKLKSNTT